MATVKKFKIELPYDPAISLLGIYPEKKNTNLKTDCTIIYNSEDMETTQVFINGRIDKD